MHPLRGDIQVLRALAVLAVLAFHFEVPGLRMGYLGVDIFFVISGYLMSRVIIEGQDAGRFRAGDFYFRRAKRLLPAAMATLALTTALAPWVLTRGALQDYAAQLGGALSFTANLVLWGQSGYFDSAAELKPLLHTWSLALEEQYYLVLPALLWAVGRRWRAAVLGSLTLISLAACVLWVQHDPSGAFYLLPTRAWEMLLGSLCALPHGRGTASPALLPRGPGRWAALISAAAALSLAICLLWGVDPVHPRGDALWVCLSTAALVWWPARWLQGHSPAHRLLHWVGDRSYSLYLVHWPLIALAKNIWLQGVPTGVRVALVVLALLLAHLSHAAVETPFRRMGTVRVWAKAMLWLLLPLAISCIWLAQQLTQPAASDWRAWMQPNQGLGIACEYDTDFTPREACRTSPRPHTLVWGDSYAMHLLPALQAGARQGGLMQATRSTCTPNLRYAALGPKDPPERALQCLSLSRSVLAYLAHAPHVHRVVIASRWQYLLDGTVLDAQGQRVRPSAAQLADSLSEVIAELHRLHKAVVIVSPPALLGPDTNLGLCTERRHQGLLTRLPALGADCSFAEADFRAQQAPVLKLLSRIGQQAHVDVIDLSRFNCHDGRCASTVDGQPLYRDAGHLSVVGAQRLGQGIGLMDHVVAQAR